MISTLYQHEKQAFYFNLAFSNNNPIVIPDLIRDPGFLLKLDPGSGAGVTEEDGSKGNMSWPGLQNKAHGPHGTQLG